MGAELDYKKRVNSQFVSRVLSYSLRTNQAIGVHQIGDFERGLLDYQRQLIGQEIHTPQYWRHELQQCVDRIESLNRIAISSPEADRQAIMSESARVKRNAEIAHRQLGILINGE